MRCPHCNNQNPDILPYSRPIANGRAYAQACERCGHVLNMRPRLDTDPPVMPDDFTPVQVARLQFVRWRLQNDRQAQIVPPQSAA